MSAANQSEMPFVESIREYISQQHDFWCMPGHKQGAGIHPQLRDLWGQDFFRYDITEVYASDVLAEPQKSLAQAQNLAAEAFGVDKTWFLVNGSSVGIIAALCAIFQPDDPVLLSRSIHKSVIAGLTLSGARPYYLSQPEGPTFAYGGVNLADLEEKLAQIRPKAVFITSPNYYGLALDINKIAAACHKHGSLLIVDEAHGTHFKFHPALPQSAIDGKADVVIHSAHKTFGALYQTALLHLVTPSSELENSIGQTLAMLQSTSPSVPLLMSIDAARSRFATEGTALMAELIDLADSLRSHMNRMGHIKTIDPPQSDLEKWGHTTYDKTRIVARVSPPAGNARDIKDYLARSCQCETELADNQHIVFTLAVGDCGKPLSAFDITLQALDQIPQGFPQATNPPANDIPNHARISIPKLIMTPQLAWRKPATTIALSLAAGRISKTTVCAYPPGTPLIVPGESISEPMIRHIRMLIASGARITGLALTENNKEEKIAVVA